MGLQMGKLIRELRKQSGMTQEELGRGIVSKAVLSRIENGQTEPDIFKLNEMLQRLGKSLVPFEVIVSCQEYEVLQRGEYDPSLQSIVVTENEYVKDIREAKGISQEKFSKDVYSRETISKIEHGRTPQFKKMRELMGKLEEPCDKYYGYVVSQDYKVHEMAEQYHQKRLKTPEAATRLLTELKCCLDREIPVNQQFLESVELMEKRRKSVITMGEELAGLECCLRYTMPEYDGMIYRIPFRQEVVILEEIVKCMKRLKRTEAAIYLEEKMQDKMNKKIKIN